MDIASQECRELVVHAANQAFLPLLHSCSFEWLLLELVNQQRILTLCGVDTL